MYYSEYDACRRLLTLLFFICLLRDEFLHLRKTVDLQPHQTSKPHLSFDRKIYIQSDKVCSFAPYKEPFLVEKKREDGRGEGLYRGLCFQSPVQPRTSRLLLLLSSQLYARSTRRRRCCLSSDIVFITFQFPRLVNLNVSRIR